MTSATVTLEDLRKAYQMKQSLDGHQVCQVLRSARAEPTAPAAKTATATPKPA